MIWMVSIDTMQYPSCLMGLRVAAYHLQFVRIFLKATLIECIKTLLSIDSCYQALLFADCLAI
jgi:hypothetical protein